MKTAVIGGTYDPVHLGHLHLLHSLVELTDYERVLVIPVASPPHKKHEQSVSNEDRLHMLDLALQEYRQLYESDRDVELLIDTCEIDRGGISYMYDTVNELYQRYAVDGLIGVVIGDDLLSGLRRWYRFEDLRHSAEFIVCRRLHERPVQVLPPGVRGQFLENPVMEDSSTAVRSMIGNGSADREKLASLVPQSVVHYILEHELYRA